MLLSRAETSGIRSHRNDGENIIEKELDLG